MWSKCAGKVWQCSAETICLHNEKVVSLDKCVNCPRAAIHKYNVERPQRGQKTGVVLGTGTRVPLSLPVTRVPVTYPGLTLNTRLYFLKS